MPPCLYWSEPTPLAAPNFICSETREYLDYAAGEGTPEIYELLREHRALTRKERYAREHAKSTTGSESGDRWFAFWLVVIPSIIALSLLHSLWSLITWLFWGLRRG